MFEKFDLISLLEKDYVNFFSSLAVTGAGGKTSLLFYLKDLLLQRGRRVVITTTTHMFPVQGMPFALDAGPECVQKHLAQEGWVIACGYDEKKEKLCAPPAANAELLYKTGACVLTEADGSKRLPVKAPAAWEPVIPAQAEAVVGVLGLDGLGQPIGKAAHRPELVCELLGKSREEILTPADLAVLAASPAGLKKGVGERPFYVCFNKADVLVKDGREKKIEKVQAQAAALGVRAFCVSLNEGWMWRAP